MRYMKYAEKFMGKKVRGAMLILIAAFLPIGFAFAGLFFDFTVAMGTKMDMANKAQLIAMAGCSQGFDKSTFMNTYKKRLIRSNALGAMETYLSHNQPKNMIYKLSGYDIREDECIIDLTLSCEVPTTMSRYFGLNSIHLEASGRAHTNMKRI